MKSKSVLNNCLKLSHEYLMRAVDEGDVCIDATAGNGYDTLFLANLVGEKGKVFAFDVQQLAIDATNERILNAGLQDRVVSFVCGHENMINKIHEDYIGRISGVIFNLGYLPGGDHYVSTCAETTMTAISAAMHLIGRYGVICVVVYSGGDSGYSEKESILEFVRTIDNKKFNVLSHDFINQPNNPPMLICIEKRI